MKLIYRCKYCDKIDTEDNIRKHEEICIHNHTRKFCSTCKNGNRILNYECKVGVEIPEGKLIEFCNSYERKEKVNNPLGNLFGNIFGL